MSSKDWISTKWGEITFLEYGKSLKRYQDSTGDIPVYGTNGLIGFTNKPLCTFPSVIIGRKGAYRGVHYSKKPFFVIDTAFYLKPKSKELNLKYAYYQLLTQDINSMDSGSAIPSTSREDFYNLEFKLPPLPTQRRIAEILSSLDDKIELNRQTNATLEAIAQVIFKEWFVNFNFPGATGETIESELGLIPKGWKIGKLGEICKVIMGQSPPGDSYNEIGEGTPFFQGRSDFGFRFPTKRIFTTNPKRFAKKFNTLVSVRAPVGDMNIAIENCCIGRGLAAVIEKNGNSTYTYYFLKHLTENFRKFEYNGTVFGSINKNDFQDMKCIIPKREMIALFETICNPIDETIYNNHQESVNLSSIRDTLLPKLINGEIEL